MPFIARILFSVLLLAGAAALLSPTASAGDPQIDQAQSQGIIGERVDGYLGVVSGPVDPALSRKVSEVNNKRRALYDKLARETGTTTEQVARITGEKQIAKAKSGEFVMLDDGVWTTK